MIEVSSITWQWLTFNELTPHQMQAMFALRQTVFIIEQNCLYLDIDGQDEVAHHLLGWNGDELVATLRVFESYDYYDGHASIGRVCTHESVRKLGLGHQLVSKAIDFIEVILQKSSIQIGAQYYLKRFYQEFGFTQISDVFDEDGIDHILMLKK
jgi:ElaA protein